MKTDLRKEINEKYKYLYLYRFSYLINVEVTDGSEERSEEEKIEIWKEVYDKILEDENTADFEAWYITGLIDAIKVFEDATYSMQDLEGDERPEINFSEMIEDIKNARKPFNEG